MIHLVHVRNPLQPTDGSVRHELTHRPGRHLDQYLLSVFSAEPSSQAGMVVSLNGAVIPHELWPGVIPRDEDSIIVSPRLEGGSLLRTLATVAVLAAAAAVTGGAAAGLGFVLGGFSGGLFAAGSISASILAGAISLGGSLLISAIASPGSPNSKSPSQTYDPDGPKSLARSGTVIPKGYGTMRSGGNIIASFTDLEGADQYINVLVCFGFGPARSLSSIQINGKDLSTYQNVQSYIRLGANDQLPIPSFNRVVNGYPQAVQCLAGVPVYVPGTGTLTQILQVDIMFPEGIFVQTPDGNTIPEVITYLVEYAPSGTPAYDPAWKSPVQPQNTASVVSYDPVTGVALNPHDWCVVATDAPANSGLVYKLDNGPHTPGDIWSGTITCEHFAANGNHYNYDRQCHGEWQPTNPLLNQVLVLSFTDGYQDFVACDRSTLYNRTSIYGLVAGKWDIRVTKFGTARLHDDAVFGDNNSPLIGQQMWIHSVNEIQLNDLAYPNMILLGIRALATNQISGSGLNVTALVEYGLRTLDYGHLPAALAAYEENNPACVVADMMLDPLYGGGQWPGILPANLTRYLDEWLSWADLCDELVDDGNGFSIRRAAFNGVIDNEGNLWDAVKTVGQMSRAIPIPLGRDYGVFVDQQDDPVQMFSMGNIVKDSFTETWLDIDARANQIEIDFADSTRYYKTGNPLVYMDPANQDSGAVIKNTRIDGKGITLPAQAWHAARFRERNNQFLLRSGSFKCDLDAIACRPGNVVILQHDVPKWGIGGRLLPGSTVSNLLLDRADIVFAPGASTPPTNYSAIVLHPALLRYSGTITAITPLLDARTGGSLGTSLALSGFTNAERVTRLVLGASYAIVNIGPGVNQEQLVNAGSDSPVLSSSVGAVVIAPASNFAGAVGQAYQLFDTDVLETRPVVSVDTRAGSLQLGTPLTQAPADYASYFYGPAGSRKLVRVTGIRKSSDFRAQIEWIDYDPEVYVDAVPVVSQTGSEITTAATVLSLAGSETFALVAGSYIGYATLTWRLGRDTAGVAIYGYVVGSLGVGAVPRLLAKLSGYPTSWQMQIDAGQTWTFLVVGCDLQGNYATFRGAPYVTIAAVGVAANLLLGSNFASGFTYWNLMPRVQPGAGAQDTLTPTFANDGEADYTVAGAPLTAPKNLLYQIVPPGKWAAGQSLMLSAYFEDSALAPATAPNVGSLQAMLVCLDAGGALLASATAMIALAGVNPTITRCNTPPTVIPANTAQILVTIGVGSSAGSVSVPVGSVLTFSHLLLEICSPGQSAPSAWADLDAAGHVLDLFTGGSSTGLRVQGSTLSVYSGFVSYAADASSATIFWQSLALQWPDGALTFIEDGTQLITGLSAATTYRAYLYFDVLNGGIRFVAPADAFGSPALVHVAPNALAYDQAAAAACRLDGRISLAYIGLEVITAAAGASAPTTGTGGGSGGNDPGGSDPIGGNPGDGSGRGPDRPVLPSPN